MHFWTKKRKKSPVDDFWSVNKKDYDGYFFSPNKNEIFGIWDVPESNEDMTDKKWERIGKIGFGDDSRNYYSLDEKGYIFVLSTNGELPLHINMKTNSETKYSLKVGIIKRFEIYKEEIILDPKEELAKSWGF